MIELALPLILVGMILSLMPAFVRRRKRVQRCNVVVPDADYLATGDPLHHRASRPESPMDRNSQDRR